MAQANGPTNFQQQACEITIQGLWNQNGTEAQDGLKAWCDNNSWFCDCTDGGQLDDLFDDIGNFTEVNTGPPRPPRITTTTTTTTSTTTTPTATTTPTTTTTTTFQPVVQPTGAPAVNQPVNQPANQVQPSSPSTTLTTTTAPPTTPDSTITPAAVSRHDHNGLNIFLLILVLFLRK